MHLSSACWIWLLFSFDISPDFSSHFSLSPSCLRSCGALRLLCFSGLPSASCFFGLIYKKPMASISTLNIAIQEPTGWQDVAMRSFWSWHCEHCRVSVSGWYSRPVGAMSLGMDGIRKKCRTSPGQCWIRKAEYRLDASECNQGRHHHFAWHLAAVCCSMLQYASRLRL